MSQTKTVAPFAANGRLADAMRFFAERMKLVTEPTGCLAAAAVLYGALAAVRGKRVGIVISGGNVDVQRYAELLAGRGA
jgi:threo-3-hydroxy-L-aspartate ammonia-lyase